MKMDKSMCSNVNTPICICYYCLLQMHFNLRLIISKHHKEGTIEIERNE